MKRIIWMLTLSFFVSCEDELESDEQDTLVVEAYLQAGQGIDEIKLTRLVRYESENTELEVTGADVFVTLDSETFQLSELKAGIYGSEEETIILEPGDQLGIDVIFEDVTTSARTVVPPKPQGLKVSEEEIFLEQITSFTDLFNQGGFNEDALTIEWENPQNDFYYVLVENLETNPEAVQELDFGDFEGFEFILPPTNLDNFSLRTPQLEYFGQYRAILYRVNEEYNDLYESSDQDSRSLNEPASNVENGLGIFTAINQDTVYFQVTKSN